MNKPLQIAIDGPAAAGKSTVAKRLSSELNLNYIDTGAMYRALTLLALENNTNIHDEEALVELLNAHKIETTDTETFIDGINVSSRIRQPDVTRTVSIVCAPAKVREQMVQMQRLLAQEGGAVMEGRDIGTVVLPNACLKIFMTASPRIRAERRKKDSKNPELADISVEQIEKEIARRDKLDSQREVAPLKPAEDAIILDTSEYSLENVVEKIIGFVKKKYKQ